MNRPNLDFRGYCGTVASGVVRQGDEVMVLPSRQHEPRRAIVTFDGELDEAFAPQAVTLTLEDEIDVSRGDMLVHPGNVPRVGKPSTPCWSGWRISPCVPGRRYLFKHSTRTSGGAVSELRYRIDVNTLKRSQCAELQLNEIGRCTIRLAEPIAYDDYAANRATGAFIVIDRLSNATVGAGMILDRSTEAQGPEHWDTAPPSDQLHAAPSSVSAEERAGVSARSRSRCCSRACPARARPASHRPSSAALFDRGHAAAVLDGESLRLGINRDLGFTEAERSESMRRAGEMARALNDAGLIVVCALTAPRAHARERMAEIVGAGRFLVVHLSAPLEVCRERHGGELYRLADRGEVANVPGLSAPYEAPDRARPEPGDGCHRYRGERRPAAGAARGAGCPRFLNQRLTPLIQEVSAKRRFARREDRNARDDVSGRELFREALIFPFME